MGPVRCLLLAAALLPLLAWGQAPWPASTPEAQGMGSRSLAALVEYGANAQMDSLVVARNGRLVAEAYYAPFRRGMRHRINSSTKAVVGLLAGVANAQGLVQPSDPVLVQLAAPGSGADPRKQAVTLQHLLDMRSGLAWVEPLTNAVPDSLIAMERSGNWLQYILAQPVAQEPGSSFNYNSGGSHLVSAFLARKTGMDTAQFADRVLFAPLGIVDYRWQKDPGGLSVGGFGLSMQTSDMARIGQLVLQGGAWEGRQLVPREWVERIYAASVPMFGASPWRYGDFWWTLPARHAYVAVGFNRQLIVVLPELGVVAAMTGRTHYPIEDVISHLERAARSREPLPDDTPALAQLQERIALAATERAPVDTAPPIAREISGQAWRMEANPLGLVQLTLQLGDQPSYELESRVARGSSETRRQSGPLGLGRFSAPPAEGAQVVTRADWVDGSTLAVEQRWLEEGWVVSYRLRFDDKRVEIEQVDRFGRRQVLAATRD